MGNTVKVKLLRTHVNARPGEMVRAFGHEFFMQPNGDVVCDMHKDFIPTETAAGRVEVIEPGPPKPDSVVPELMQFSMEVEDFYGLGDMDKLYTALSRLRKELLIEFARTRLSVDIPDAMANNKILKQIRTLVMTAHQEHGGAESDQSEEDEQSQQEDSDDAK